MCNAELESFTGISSDDCSLHLRITVSYCSFENSGKHSTLQVLEPFFTVQLSCFKLRAISGDKN